MPMIWVINFPFCNFFGLDRYLRVRGQSYQIASENDKISLDDSILLPGVGTFGQGMNYLRVSGLDRLIIKHASSGGKIVGICLGMQLFLQSSSESPGVEGLGMIPGACERIPENNLFSVPHIGWDALVFPESLHRSFAQFGKTLGLSRSDYYFVHSYYANPQCMDSVVAAFDHPTGLLAAAIAVNNVIGFQFHPEKSGPAGYELLDCVLDS